MSSPKDFHIDAVYPEPLSRLRRGTGMGIGGNEAPTSSSYRRAVKKQMNRSSGRFRTQPVTFHEIKEVDEENIVEVEAEIACSAAAASKSESDLKAKFELFYRSINSNVDNLPTTKHSHSTGIKLSSSNNNLPVCNPATHAESMNRRNLTYEDASPTATTSPVAILFNTKSRPSL